MGRTSFFNSGSFLVKTTVPTIHIAPPKIKRIKYAVDAIKIDMTLEQLYQIYIAALGKELP
jgi:predicted oxidoreductase